MDINRLNFNLFLVKNLLFLYIISVITILIVYSSAIVFLNCFIYLLFSLPIFLLNTYNIRQNKIISYIVFSGLNLVNFFIYLNKIYTKETVTRWKNVNGVLVEYTKTFYFYEINRGSVHFELINIGVFLIIQFIVWIIIIKKINQFEIDL